MARSRPPRALLVQPDSGPGKNSTERRAGSEPLLDPAPPFAAPASTELYVWFEDTCASRITNRPAAAGFPECLLPYGKGVRVLERRYAEGHLHLLSAARIRCDERLAECVAVIYTQALALGTIAWIGTGEQYRRAWVRMYAGGARRARRRGEKPVT
jgi:hypothetical protein